MAASLEKAEVRALYLVQGSQGQYSNYDTWIVSGWLSQDAAEAEAKRLNEVSASYEKEKAELGEAPSPLGDEDRAPFNLWCRKQDQLEEKWQKISGDDRLGDPYSETDYAVLITELRD